jgi:type I pantothenate kinase
MKINSLKDNWNSLTIDILSALEQKNTKVNLIQIAGSVAVGKTTFAKTLEKVIQEKKPNYRVLTISTDHFLNTNKKIESTCGLNKKGFPQSYNQQLIENFFSAYIKQRKVISLPVYSHHAYDILSNKTQSYDFPDILIVEGVIALNENCINVDGVRVFIDAQLDLIRSWYEKRFLHLCASSDETSFFANFISLSQQELLTKMNKVWQNINLPNWYENIQATRSCADFIVHKAKDHSWSYSKVNVR